VEHQEVEAIDADALQAAFGGHPDVVGVAVRAAQGGVGEAREALGPGALALVEVVADRPDHHHVVAGHAGQRAAEHLVGLTGAVDVRGDDGADVRAGGEEGEQPVVVDRCAPLQIPGDLRV